jgi:extracellular factor (EF) 3-hydroxypalmitic acid methyl ester biosynthesis protein
MISNTIASLEVRVSDTLLYSGKGTIVTLSSDQGKVIVGISLGEKCDNLNDLIMEDRETDPVDLKSRFLKLEKVNTSFKALVADIRYALEAVQEAMAKEEEKSSLEGAVHRHRIEKTVLERFERFVFNYLDGAVKDLNQLVCNFDEPAHAVHRDYFQKQLGAIIGQSPFVKRSYSKPLGYAGDYEMMDMMYRDPYEGETFFGKLLNKYFCHHVKLAEACRNRIPYLLRKIEQVAEKGGRHGKRSRILSLACGPANEAAQFIRNNKASDNTDLSFIDIEPEDLYYTNAMLLEAKMQHERQTRINVYYISILNLIRDAQTSLHHQNLVYCVGLFDYLSDDICKKVIIRLFKMLREEGMLVIGNFERSDTIKILMEYSLEWYLIYRTQNDLLRLANEAVPGEACIFCEAEPTGINNFLIIKR